MAKINFYAPGHSTTSEAWEYSYDNLSRQQQVVQDDDMMTTGGELTTSYE